VAFGFENVAAQPEVLKEAVYSCELDVCGRM